MCWRWVARCGGGSGCLVVLVDDSATGGVSSDRLAGPIGDDFGVVGGPFAQRPVGPGRVVLSARPVGPVRVVVLDVVAEEPPELLAVPDEGAVEKLAAHGADPTFRVRV